MKRRLKRWYLSLKIRLTRDDVCHRHWVRKERRIREYSSDSYGNCTHHVRVVCAQCDDERLAAEDKAALEAERRAKQREEDFDKALELLRKEYL